MPAQYFDDFPTEETPLLVFAPPPRKCLPTRVIICIMMFTACWTSYMCRLQMSVLVVPMIKTAEDGSNLSGVCTTVNRNKRSLYSAPEEDVTQSPSNKTLEGDLPLESINQPNLIFRSVIPEVRKDTRPPGIYLFSNQPFNWSPFIRGQLISAYAWGNVPGNFIGGVLAQKYGPRQAILWSSILAALVSLITPILAQTSWIALLFSRVIIGLTGGVTFPACHNLVAKWSPPNEKGRFIWTLQGGTFGSIFLFGIISSIAEKINWESAWYIPAISMLIWVIFWWLFAFDSPEEHPGINEEEKKYIIESQVGIVNVSKPTLKDTPILKILSSLPFICLALCHFGNLFLLFFYQNGMMLYQTKALGFKLTKGGIVSGLPWANRVLFAFIFGWAGDTIKRKNLLSITKLRKIATIFSHLLPGLCLIIVGYLGCSFTLANVFLILALGFNGAASVSNLSNNQDLSPNYAGFLYGLMNTFGGLSGIIIGPIVEEVAGKWGHSIERWRILFWMGASVCISCMVIFVIGGSGEVQSWNEIEPREERRDSNKKTNKKSDESGPSIRMSEA